jgi:hypothetical protein
VKAAAAVLVASLVFFAGVLTGAGRREAVPPPAAISLGGPEVPAGRGAPRPTSPDDAPGGAAKGTATSTATSTAATGPAGTTGSTAPPGAPATATTTAPTGAPTSPTTAPATSSSTATTGAPGQVEQVDNQVDCRAERRQGKGKREPCPATTTSTGEAPGGGPDR